MEIKLNNNLIKRAYVKISAIVEKNIRMKLRFKFHLLMTYISLFISLLMPIIVFGKLFELRADIGPWTSNNYIVFIFLGYTILLLSKMIKEVPSQLRVEKYWKTLPAITISPFNRFYLLFGYHLTEFLLVLPPFFIFLFVAYIISPISIVTLFTIFLIFFAISLIFTGIGFIIGVFAISNENIWAILGFGITLIMWASCITYPYALFPDQVQAIINYNPIYYIIDLFRLFWVEDNILLTISLHSERVIILISSLIIFPLSGVLTFNYIYKKLGISGY